MATWVRSGTGTAPSATDVDLTGSVSLDNATAPGDFDPDAVNSVRFQWRLAITGLSNDTWDDRDRGGLWLTGPGFVANVLGTDPTNRTANGNYDKDMTDSSVSTGASIAQWEGAVFDPTGINGWATYNKVKGADGTTASIPLVNVTITIDYTPAVATITPGLASQLVTTFAPTLTTGDVGMTPGLAESLTTSFAPDVWMPTSIQYRWAEDSTAASPTWLAAQNVDTEWDNDANEERLLYLRFKIDGNPPAVNWKLLYRRNGGSWVPLDAGPPGANEVSAFNSVNLTNDAYWDTTLQLTGEAGYNDSLGYQKEDNLPNSIDYNAAVDPEWVYALKLGTATDGDTFEFAMGVEVNGAYRVIVGTYALATVPTPVTITPGLAQSLVTAFAPQVWSYLTDVIHYRWADDSVITSPTWAAAEDVALQVPVGTSNDKILFWRWAADGNPPSQLHHAEYRLNGGAWTNVITGSTGAMHSYNSANIAPGVWSTANFHTTPGTRTEYNGRQSDAFTGSTIDLISGATDGGETEWLFAPGFYLASAGDVFELRIVVSPQGDPATETFLVDFGVVASVPQEITPGLAQSLVTAFDPTVAHFDLIHARWSTDTTLTAPSWQSAEDGPLAIPLGGSTYIIYMLGGQYGKGSLRTNGLSYRKNGGSWAVIPTTNAAGPHLFNSTNVSNGISWTTANFQLTAGGTLTPINGIQWDTMAGSNWNPAADSEFEWLWAIEFEGVVAGDEFDFAFNLAGDYADPETHSLFVTAYAPQTITPGLASQLTTAFDPTVATDAFSITPGLAQQLTTAFDPTIVADQAITPPLAQELVNTFAPTLVREALLKLTAFEVTGNYTATGPITPGLAQSLTQAFDPNVKHRNAIVSRWAEDSTLTAPTWAAAEDAQLHLPAGTSDWILYRRFGTTGDPGNYTYQLWYRKNGGSWAVLPSTPAAGLPSAYDSSNITNATSWATGNFQTTAGGLTEEQGWQLDTGVGIGWNYGADTETEWPQAVRFTSIDANDTFEFRTEITGGPEAGEIFGVAIGSAVGPQYITPGLAQQLATTFDPTVSLGASFMTPGLAQSLATAFDPTLAYTYQIDPDLGQSLIVGFNPTLAYTYDVAPGLATSLATAFDPTVAVGPVSLTPDLAQSLAVGFDPTVVLGTQYITPGLVSQLVTPFGPLVSISGGDQFVAPALTEQLVTTFGPTVAAGSVSVTPGLASSLAQAFDPTVTVGAVTITPGLAQQIATPFDPTLTTTYGITPGLASNVAVAFDPSIATGPVSITPGLATSLAQAFDPAVALGADYLFPDLAQQLAVAFDPSGIAQTQNIAPALVSQLVVTFDPFVDLGTKYLFPDLATQTLTAFAPVVMYWMPTLPGVTGPTGQLGGTTTRPTKVGVTAGSDDIGVTSGSGRLAYTDPET